VDRPAPPETVYRGDILRLLAKIDRERGLDLSQYRRSYVERRIASRLRTLGLHTYRQYAHFIDDHPDEYAQMVDTLTINVTDFFRDPPVYRIFRDEVVPAIIAAKLAGRQRMFRAWSAGCATGEEPYSIAMSFLSELGPRASRFMLSVTGTDLDPGALAIAAKGEYDVAKLAHVPKEDQREFLDVHGDRFTVKPGLRRLVRFQPLNLFTDPPIRVVDVVFCRNVFIYFTREQQASVLASFSVALARGGYLVLGRSEKMPNELLVDFEAVSGRERIYRKRA
jgi:chemotaxis methyl-accepting protein methylase